MYVMKAGIISNKYTIVVVSAIGCLMIIYMNSILFPIRNRYEMDREVHTKNISHIRMEYRPLNSMERDQNPLQTSDKQPIFNKKCLFVWRGVERPLRIPSKTELDNYCLHDMSCLFNRYLTTLKTVCNRQIFMGALQNGKGVMFCSDMDQESSENVCFYENEMKEYYHLLVDMVQQSSIFNVTYFYRSNPLNVSVNSGKGILNQIQVTKNSDALQRKLDNSVNIVAIVIQHSILKSFENFLRSNSLKNVRVLILKVHYKTSIYTKEGLRQWMEALRTIYIKKFHIYWFDRIYNCVSKNPKFNDCFTVSFIKRNKVTRKFSYVFPKKSAIMKMSDKSAIETYHTFLSNIQYHCKEIVRVGHAKDGGWDVCIDDKYVPSKACVVYSFGINFDWTFDEEVSKSFGCHVYSYDPSLDLPIHMHSPRVHFFNIGISGKNTNIQGVVRKSRTLKRNSTWELRTLQNILEKNGHLNRRIDILKMDVETSEWRSIPNMISTGVLKNVRQLYVEFHGVGNRKQLLVLKQLYDEGFRVFWTHRNPVACKGSMNSAMYCKYLEIYFVNIHI